MLRRLSYSPVPAELLQRELEQICELPYSMWRDMIGAPMARTVTGSDGRAYAITIDAAWGQNDAGDIQVTLTLRPTTRGFAKPFRQCFVISKDGHLQLPAQ